MDIWVIIVMAIFTSANLGFIKLKLEQDRNADAAVDAVVLVVLAYVFGGSIMGLSVATVASGLISLYLYISPPDKLIEKYSKNNKKDSNIIY